MDVGMFVCVLLMMVSSVWSAEGRIGTVGQSYLWNCSSQAFDPKDTIYWQNKNDSLVLFFYKNGLPEETHIDCQFKKRTSVFHEKIASGNLSLVINPLKVEDDGLEVKVKVLGIDEPMCQLNISVAAPYSDLWVYQYEDNATCSAVGGYPKLNLTWTGLKKNNDSVSALALNSMEPLKNGTYWVHSSVSINGFNSVTCHLQNPLVNQYISKELKVLKYPVSQDGPSGEKDWVAIGIAIAEAFVIAGLVIYCIKKTCQNEPAPDPRELDQLNDN